MRTANGCVASSTRSAPPCARKSVKLASVKPPTSTVRACCIAPKRCALPPAVVTVALTAKPASSKARASIGPSEAPLSRRTFADTASPPENVRMRRVIQTRAVFSIANRLTHQDQRGARQVMLTDLAMKVLQTRHNNLFVWPRYPVQNRYRRLRGVGG